MYRTEEAYETYLTVNNIRVTNDVITRDNYGYSSHSLTEVVDGKNRNEWILIIRSRAGK